MTTFFSDRDLGRTFGSVLKNAGIHVELHDTHFPPMTADTNWIPFAAERDWFILTHDRRIRYVPIEVATVMASHAGLFVLLGKASPAELAHNFVRTLGSVMGFIDRNPRPFIAKVYRPSPSELHSRPDAGGRVEMWLTGKQWQVGQGITRPRRRR